MAGSTPLRDDDLLRERDRMWFELYLMHDRNARKVARLTGYNHSHICQRLRGVPRSVRQYIAKKVEKQRLVLREIAAELEAADA